MSKDRWFKELYEANYDRLYKLAAYRLKAYTGSEADVPDVLQDVFFLAVEKEIWDHPNPEGWLIITTANICKNYIRAAMRNFEKQRKCAQESFKKDVHHSLLFSSSADETEAADIHMTIEQALSPEEQKLFRDYCVEKKPVEEIAKNEACNSNAIRVRIFRIRSKLKKIFF